MRTYRVRYTPAASAIIRKLHPTIKVSVRAGIREISQVPLVGKELQLELSGFRSFRVGRYRIIYTVNEEESCVEIHHVGPRRGVYKSLRDLLSGARLPR